MNKNCDPLQIHIDSETQIERQLLCAKTLRAWRDAEQYTWPIVCNLPLRKLEKVLTDIRDVYANAYLYHYEYLQVENRHIERESRIFLRNLIRFDRNGAYFEMLESISCIRSEEDEIILRLIIWKECFEAYSKYFYLDRELATCSLEEIETDIHEFAMFLYATSNIIRSLSHSSPMYGNECGLLLAKISYHWEHFTEYLHQIMDTLELYMLKKALKLD